MKLRSTPGLRLFKVEKRAIGSNKATCGRELDQLHTSLFVCPCDRAIGGSEINPEHKWRTVT
jgi:hypothetical protein